MDELILQTILKNLEKGIKSVLATIIRTEGSTSRGPGTQMLIMENEQSIGTIGGGSIERQVFQKALALMTMGSQFRAEILHLRTNNESRSGEISSCGGNQDILMELIQSQDLWELAFGLQMNVKGAVVVTALFPPYLKSIFDAEGKLIWGSENNFSSSSHIGVICSKKQVEVVALNEEQSWLVEPILKKERLLILGAGHVAKAVAYYAKNLDFEITVIDERESFTKPEYFPRVHEVICSDLETGIINYQPNENTYVVIATWSHQTDAACVSEVLKFNTKYVGMLGSIKKVAAITHKLQEDGYSSQNIDRLRAPIGLQIGAQTPSEIALSIMAEIISVRRTV